MAADIDPVYLGNHDVQQDQVWLLGSGDGERLFAVGCGEDPIAVDSKAGLEDVQVHWLVVHNEDAWRRSHVLLFALVVRQRDSDGSPTVMPAQAGIQVPCSPSLDSRFRGNDEKRDHSSFSL